MAFIYLISTNLLDIDFNIETLQRISIADTNVRSAISIKNLIINLIIGKSIFLR